jgi:hypothetical protein
MDPAVEVEAVVSGSVGSKSEVVIVVVISSSARPMIEGS